MVALLRRVAICLVQSASYVLQHHVVLVFCCCCVPMVCDSGIVCMPLAFTGLPSQCAVVTRSYLVSCEVEGRGWP